MAKMTEAERKKAQQKAKQKALRIGKANDTMKGTMSAIERRRRILDNI